ncbi:MAG: acyltransferase family protein [Trueperella sp.]|nr:acyltransferase family protein [Trueperella sp.]
MNRRVRTDRLRTPAPSHSQSAAAPSPNRQSRPRRKVHPMSDPGGYIRGLDGLRALAVSAVVLYHVLPAQVPGGLLGVDVFFVLSGFLITTLLVREFRTTHTVDLRGFWVRRIRRLVPALIALVLLVVPTAWAINKDLLVGIGRQVLGALTFSTNWLEIAHGSSYFDQTTPLLFKNFWSLAIEEQFYVLWPILALLVLTLGLRGRLLVVGGVGLLSALAMALLYDPENLTRVYYGTDTHLFGIAAGVWLAFSWTDPQARVLGNTRWRRYGNAAGWLALGALIAMFALVDGQGAFAYRGGMLLAAVLAGTIIAAMLIPGSKLASLGELRVFKWLGTRSYGLYLWHWPVLVICAVAMPAAVGSAGYWVRSAVALVVTGIICELSFRFLETPVRQVGIRDSLIWLGEQWQYRRGKIGAAILAALLIGTIGGIIAAPAKSQTQLTIEKEQQEIAAQKAAAQAAADAEKAKAVPDIPKKVPAPPQQLPKDFDSTFPENGEITALGDSMVVASKTGLQAAIPGMTVVAESNLKWSDAPQWVHDALVNDQVGRVVVVHFGTNAGVPDEADVRRALYLLGPKRMVLLVNLYSPSTFIEDANKRLQQIASEYPNVQLVDWHAVATKNPDLLQVDATHTSIAGANAYGALVQDEIAKFASELSAQRKVDPETGKPVADGSGAADRG